MGGRAGGWCFLVLGVGVVFSVGGGDAGASTLCSDTGGATMGTLGAGVDGRTGNGGAGSGRAVARFRIWAIWM